jgi:YHS domain-containing protein
MTPPRRERKQNRASSAAFAVALALFSMAVPALAGLTQRVVVNWHSGLAIDGYDPVAFFTDGKPEAGSGDFESRYAGAIWRFVNSGNLAAFTQRPDVYMPQYGGYDPVGVARGVAVPGNPRVWAIVGERLFLFYDGAQREKFLSNPARYLAMSQRRWPDVMSTLDP